MLLRRALRNLIDNALAYGARARLSVVREGDHARIIVSDDGPGLTDEQIRTLVEPFARGEQSRNRATGGAGLGPVSYTHLDVYKRQAFAAASCQLSPIGPPRAGGRTSFFADSHDR